MRGSHHSIFKFAKIDYTKWQKTWFTLFTYQSIIKEWWLPLAKTSRGRLYCLRLYGTHNFKNFQTLLQHPWVIVIKDEDDKLHCGGAIASSNRLISAGHCFVNEVTKKEMTKTQKQKFKVQVDTDIPFEYKG